MKNGNVPGLSPLWLLSLAMALGVFLSVSIPLVVSTNAINSTAWISFSGSIIGGAVAIAAVVVATRNVRRQVRVGLLSREEERIEAVLPGLREIAGYLDRLLKQFRSISGDKVIRVINDFNEIETEEHSLSDKLKEFVPNADERSRQRLHLILQGILVHAYHASQAEKHFVTSKARLLREKDAGLVVNEISQTARTAETSLNSKVRALQSGMAELREFEKEILRTINLFEARLPRFREELEAYFDE
jgi:hypothetical protein